MISDEIREKLQNIVRGALLQGQEDHCSAIRNLLSQSFGSDPTVKREFESRAVLKEKQACFLKTHAEKYALWLPSLPAESQYLTRGGESEIYLAPDKRHVFKVNDAVYYATWTEYFNSLVIHNLLFPNTAYMVFGFTIGNNGNLCVALKQPFIEGGQAELPDIKELLTFTRSYIVTLAFIVSGSLLKLPLIQRLGEFADISPSFFWLGWSVPLYLYEVVLSFQKKN